MARDYLKRPKSCTKCGSRRGHLVPAYWSQDWLCSECVQHFTRVHDREGWPQEGRMDGEDAPPRPGLGPYGEEPF